MEVIATTKVLIMKNLKCSPWFILNFLNGFGFSYIFKKKTSLVDMTTTM